MPLEIRELNIKVTVSDAPESSGATNGATQNTGTTTPDAQGNQAALIQEVVDKVMDILKQKMER